LFVDDEQAVLDGLRNVLRKYRKEWDISFALGGDVALGLMSKSPFDVVVSDMRMPKMDGAALLTRVKDEHPATLRIILTGYAEQKDLLRALPVAHQMLSKPCNADALPTIISQADELRGLISDDTLRKMVGKVDRLPMPPRLYFQLTSAMSGSDTSMAKVAGLVEQDPSLSARLLQFVNSAFFGMARRVNSVQQAATLLGCDTIRSLVLTAHVVETLERLTPPEFSYGRLQMHSILVARIAKRLAPTGPESQLAFTAGVLHDIGKVILAVVFPDKFREAATAASGGRPQVECERELLGFSHAEIGAYLLGLWGLPPALIECTAHHHDYARRPENNLLKLIAAANALAHGAETLDEALLQPLGGPARLPSLIDIAKEETKACLSS
jgi:putative nucleotidyltransferase with HDIG domain